MSNHIRYNDNAKPYNNSNKRHNKNEDDEKKNNKNKRNFCNGCLINRYNNKLLHDCPTASFLTYSINIFILRKSLEIDKEQ